MAANLSPYEIVELATSRVIGDAVYQLRQVWPKADYDEDVFISDHFDVVTAIMVIELACNTRDREVYDELQQTMIEVGNRDGQD